MSAINFSPGSSGTVARDYGYHHHRPVARAQTRQQTASASLTFKVQTAEGDVVELSIDAQSLQQYTRARARDHGVTAQSTSSTQAAQVSVNLSVQGDLNDQEIQDITNLLGALSTGQTPADVPSSLEAYSYQTARSFSTTQANVQIYG